ncbi:ATP-binding cassette domain-containing protein [Aliagarivorans marinus]|uniref:ATP-binding cassette domain-containing protein n=1 Tax=Aliagarivorans marinus TaxID=561965 RepID=UPI0004037DBB|nr:ATP-binding cassette domain-containing protein [Aliagarivorans marinus]
MLELNQLSIRFSGDARHLFSPLSFEVAPGEVAAVMGPSGCGKSTLLAAIAGTLSRCFTASGEIVLNQRQLLKLPQARRRVGILFQDDLLFPHFNVEQNLRFALGDVSRDEAERRIAQVLEQAELSGYQQRDIGHLSGGQRARVSVLRSLLAEPELLLLDEPFSKLDKALRAQFREFVFAQIKAMNIPALLVTHDHDDVPHAAQVHALQ